ncbi:MAG: RNA polymerase sigma factor [Acidobacteriota bacterium]
MSQEPDSRVESLIPPQPIPEGAQAFSKQVHSLLDGRPKDDATVAKAFDGMDDMFDRIAAGLYTLASMLVGEGEESVRLVEKAVATTEVSPCDDPLQARKRCRTALCGAALDTIVRRDAGSLAAPQGFEAAGGCIEEDDLESAGVSREELERMIAGPDRDRVRQWLAQLSTELRTVFVLRAVAGFTAAETAGMLAGHGGERAAGWTAQAVRELFRQALCSLASQLIQNSAAR